jgi:hypothetical protein
VKVDPARNRKRSDEMAEAIHGSLETNGQQNERFCAD